MAFGNGICPFAANEKGKWNCSETCSLYWKHYDMNSTSKKNMTKDSYNYTGTGECIIWTYFNMALKNQFNFNVTKPKDEEYDNSFDVMN